MAFVKFSVSPEWEKKLNSLTGMYDDVCKKMLDAGAKVMHQRLKQTKFGKYLRKRRPKKNKYGWFIQVQYKGNVKSGTPAAIAATVYEYGRGGRAPQPARPQIRPAIQNMEGEVVEAMDVALDDFIDKA